MRLVCSVALSLSLLAAVLASRHWPLIGDASLMHYIVFLMHHGLTPYKDIADVNLPGTYALESAAMWLFGDGAAGWRVYDFALLVAALSFHLYPFLDPFFKQQQLLVGFLEYT